MTVIVGLQLNNSVVIGGDTMSSDDTGLFPRLDEKVFLVGDVLFGCADSYRVAQVIRYGLELPPHPEGMSDMAYLVTEFTGALRRTLKAAGAIRREQETDTYEGTLLMAYRGLLAEVGEDFSIAIPRGGYVAIGSGALVALGALHATRKNKDPKKRVLLALEAAAEHAHGCRGPFVVMRSS
jgi:ATP-dependent protease HslVU (ClpYQ) peptidase subunit